MAAMMRLMNDIRRIEALTCPKDVNVSDLTFNYVSNSPYIHSLGALNVNHMGYEKWSLLKCLIQDYDIFFVMEAWTNLPDLPGYDKLTDSSIYYNTLYYKSGLDISPLIIDHGFSIQLKDVWYLLYIPPNNKYFCFPNGKIVGDINWASNSFQEPTYHETSNKYNGTSTINCASIYKHIYWSDHDLVEVNINEESKTTYVIDNNRIPYCLKKSAITGKFNAPIKIKNKRYQTRNLNFRARLYTTDVKKVYNSEGISDQLMKPWKDILKHDDTKQTSLFNSKVDTSRCVKLKTKAKDSLGLNVNLVIETWKNMETSKKVNIVDSLRDNMNIKGILLKKKEFAGKKFDIKNFRIICILPTFIKLKESYLDFNVLDQFLNPAIIGFRKGKSVEKLLDFFKSSVT